MIVTVLAAMAVASAYPDPIAPASDGKAMCFMPDSVRKTCMSIGSYEDNGDGTFTNLGTMLLPGQPVTIVQLKTVVTAKDGAVCGAIHAKDMYSATVAVDGKRLSPAEAQPLLDWLTDSVFSNIIDEDICTTYELRDGQLTSKASLHGKPFGTDAPVKWVAPDEGYKVAPRY